MTSMKKAQPHDCRKRLVLINGRQKTSYECSSEKGPTATNTVFMNMLGCSVEMKFSFFNFVLVSRTGRSFKIPARHKHKPLAPMPSLAQTLLRQKGEINSGHLQTIIPHTWAKLSFTRFEWNFYLN